jgi:hypothetical protein
MRGRQFGAAIGARVTTKPNQSDWAWANVIVLVKQAADVWWREAKAAKAPIVWDVLDFWRQPQENGLTEAQLVHEIVLRRDAYAIDTLIGATQAMATAIGGVYLPHHHRIGLISSPVRPRLRVVAYEGSTRYLGSWRLALEQVCARRGLTFVINPPDLSQADLLVAFRGDHWDGWACRQWKSGVKYVNAMAAGRPILTQASAAFDEIRPIGAVVNDPADLGRAIDRYASDEALRQLARESGRHRAPTFAIESVARTYVDLLHRVARRAA